MGCLKHCIGLLAAVLAFACPGAAAAHSRSPWTGFVVEASARFGIPTTWIWRVMAVESGSRTSLNGRPIRSPKGAMGLMQIMPHTWRLLRTMYRLGNDADDPHDNIIAGTAYLRMMYDRFGYPGLFGAYNAGPRRYAASLQGGRLPRQTIDYLAATAGGRASPVGAERSSRKSQVFAIAPRVVLPAPSDARAAEARFVDRAPIGSDVTGLFAIARRP